MQQHGLYVETQKLFPTIFVDIIVNYVDSEADNEMEILINPHSLQQDGFGGLVDRMLASGSRVRGFKPGRSLWIFSV
jgi:hypothetical protein